MFENDPSLSFPEARRLAQQTLGPVEVVALVSISETEASLSATGHAEVDKSGTAESTEEARDSGGLEVAECI